MMSTRSLVLLVSILSLISCSTPSPFQRGWPPKNNQKSNPMELKNTDDSYLWLEEVESPKALDWAKAQNLQSTSLLEKDPRYKQIETDLEKIFLSQDRIPFPDEYSNGEIYNFWQDEKAVRGVWRKTS